MDKYRIKSTNNPNIYELQERRFLVLWRTIAVGTIKQVASFSIDLVHRENRNLAIEEI